MSERPTLTREEVEQAIARLRRALDLVESNSAAADAYRAAITRHERQLAEIEEARQ